MEAAEDQGEVHVVDAHVTGSAAGARSGWDVRRFVSVRIRRTNRIAAPKHVSTPSTSDGDDSVTV